ncbi:hypothetical protein VUR80DRAFT_3531 [Thermomyces stellatus]
MNSVTRTIGKLTRRSPRDNARVSNLLNDYEDIDKLLAKLVSEARSLRDSWHTMVVSQLDTAGEYVTLYDPITGATDGHGRRAEPTPELQLNRTFNLRQAFEDTKDDMLAEIKSFEAGVIRPGTDARNHIQPLRRTINKREKKRLNYEYCSEKVKKLQRKPGKSARDDAAMHKAEDELARATEEFQVADNHLKETWPPIINAVFNLVPLLLATIINTQNRLLGMSYTTIHQYCTENDLPSPAPPMEVVVEEWESAFGPIQKEVEAFHIVKSGRPTRPPPGGANGKQVPSLSTNGISRAAPRLISGNSGIDSRRPSATEERPARTPGPRPGAPKPSASYSSGVATDFTVATELSNASAISSPGPSGPAEQYGHTTKRQTSDLAASVVGKKKPPAPPLKNFNRPDESVVGKKKPPPPPLKNFNRPDESVVGKKKPPPPPLENFNRPDESVVALYDFNGEGQGDLSFQEGDLIKVVKKTETEQDWWVGELRGVRGNFPANYCRPA